MIILLQKKAANLFLFSMDDKWLECRKLCFLFSISLLVDSLCVLLKKCNSEKFSIIVALLLIEHLCLSLLLT